MFYFILYLEFAKKKIVSVSPIPLPWRNAKLEVLANLKKIVKLSSFGFMSSKSLQIVNCSETPENPTPCPSKKAWQVF